MEPLRIVGQCGMDLGCGHSGGDRGGGEMFGRCKLLDIDQQQRGILAPGFGHRQGIAVGCA